MTKNKDWTGNGNSIFKMLGASNHTDKERETHDFYATSPEAIDLLKKKIDLPRDQSQCEYKYERSYELRKEVQCLIRN